jgi:cytochrome c peroxidase
MHGQGNFFDRGLDNANRFPIAAKAGFGHVTNSTELITSKLAALHFYQLGLPAPNAPKGSFDPVAAKRGKEIFNGAAKCSTCHVPPLYTEPGWNMHTLNDVCVDGFQANRSPDRRYRTSPLAGLWTHAKGGFYHDGRFPTLLDVVNHYDSCFNVGLTDQDKMDLVQYLNSIPRD